jgi:putative DNA primase/helicase
MMDARTLAQALGGHVVNRNNVSAPGPGHSRADRSLSITIDPKAPDGFLTYSHCGDDWRTCRDYVRSRIGLPAWQPGDGRDRRVAPHRLQDFDRAAIDAESEHRWRTPDDLQRMQRAAAIWSEGVDPRGTLAEKYLASRAIVIADDLAGRVLRFHPCMPWRDEDTGATVYRPALLAIFRSIDDDVVTAIQRVALNADGTKVGRRMLGVVHRSAVKLGVRGDTLHVGEGIETCLAARQLGFTPAWALGSVGMIAKFPVLEDVKQLSIFGEAGKASADAIQIVGVRWRNAGRKVRVVMPKGDLSDLNDVLIARANNKAQAENQGHQEERNPEMSGDQ